MFMSKFEKQAYALLRIIAGFLFLWHGSQKFFDFPPLPDGVVVPVYIVAIAGTVEFLGGLLICVGLCTRWVAFVASGEMAYAYWSSHGTHAVLPFMNHGEMAMLYCFLFLFISASGAGIWSIDHFLQRKK
jgi:putative oxidoreductase